MNKESNFSFWLIIVVVGIFVVTVFLLFNPNQNKERGAGETITINEGKPEATTITFNRTKKSAHYESNTPTHGAVLSGVPVNVVIDFNFDLTLLSEISIKKDGKEYGTGETIIDPSNLTMRKSMGSSAPNGLYDVTYKACWADGSCHSGNFQFVIDKTSAESFRDMRGKSEVTIDMLDISFQTQKIRISKGTKITWINKDSVIHTVNTDAHPSHTYFLPQNSRNLKKGDTFSVTFDKSGIYPYHCTPHAGRMIGTILVD